MREWRVTLLIAATIPVCLCATFVALDLFGRSLNVISLAGLAFAVGMVVEGAIVVSGNVVRLREGGMPLEEACRKGARQVAGALLASTATTVAVFVPVLFLKDVEGQLFGDLALTISIAVAISVVAALTLLPVALSFALQPPAAPERLWAGLAAAHRVGAARHRYAPEAARLDRGPAAAAAAAHLVAAAAARLPAAGEACGHRCVLRLPARHEPGGGQSRAAAARCSSACARTWRAAPSRSSRTGTSRAWPGGGTIGARVIDESRIGELETLVRDKITVGLPDTRVFTVEGDLFGGIGGSVRSVGIHLQSEDTAALNRVAIEGRALLEKVFPGAAVQSFPNPEDVALELHAVPDDRRIAEVGLGPRDAGHRGAHRRRRCLARRVLRRQVAAADHPALERRHDARGAGQRAADDARQVRSCASATWCNCRPCSGRRRYAASITGARSRSPSIRRATLSLEKVLQHHRHATCCRRCAPHLPADGSMRLAGSADSLSETLTDHEPGVRAGARSCCCC